MHSGYYVFAHAMESAPLYSMSPTTEETLSTDTDPLARKAAADAAIEQAAERLRDLLVEAAMQLRPFPSFPGAFFTCAIECEPPAGAGPEFGCVVVKEDGELYELRMGLDAPRDELGIAFTDPVSMRSEETKPLQLHPLDYLLYAYNGLVAVTEKLLEQRAEPK